MTSCENRGTDRATDCKYNCPARMSDSRHFTDHRPRCAVNFEAQPKPMSSFDYRMYLTHNAESLINHNRSYAEILMNCGLCTQPSTMLPEQHQQLCDSRNCSFPVLDPDGLGVGRKYGGEKNSYRPEEIKGCSVSTNDMNLYPINGNVGDNYNLLTGPTGYPTR